MRSIAIWYPAYPQKIHEVRLLDDTPDDKYIAIRDDLGEVVMIPVDKWDEFIKACQKLEVTP